MSQPLITALIPGTGFPGLDDYRSRQAVFFDDSITDGWDLSQSFPGNPNAEGYRVMAPLAENAVQAALSKGDGDSPSGSR